MPITALVSSVWVCEWLEENSHHLETAEIITLAHKLNVDRDLRDSVIEEAFQTIHRNAYGYSEADARLFDLTLQGLNDAGNIAQAAACQRYVDALAERAAQAATCTTHTPSRGTQSGWEGFAELDGSTMANEPYAFIFKADRALEDREIDQIASLIGYAYRVTVSGEPMGLPQRLSSTAFKIAADTTKSYRDDISQAMAQFLDRIPTYLTDGSPVRTSNRKGPGTKDTRLIEGLGEAAPKLTVYADDTITHTH